MPEDPWDRVYYTGIVKEGETSWDLMDSFPKVGRWLVEAAAAGGLSDQPQKSAQDSRSPMAWLSRYNKNVPNWCLLLSNPLSLSSAELKAGHPFV